MTTLNRRSRLPLPNETLERTWSQFEAHLAKGLLAAADAVAMKARVAFAGDARTHVMLARVARERSGPAAGLKVLDDLPKVHRDSAVVTAWTARLALESGDMPRAAELLASLPTGGDPQPPHLWTRARLAHARADHDAAAADLAALTHATPEDRDSWRLLGTCLVAAGKPKIAVIALEYVLAQDRQHAPTWRSLVDALVAAGDVATAFTRTQEGLKIHPKDPDLLATATRLRALHTATGTDVQARILEAQLLLDTDDTAGAEKILHHLKSLHPGSRSVGFLSDELAAARAPAQELPRLYPPALKQVTNQPALLEPRFILLRILLRPSTVRNPGTALAMAEQAWRMVPGHPHAGFLLVSALVAAGRLEQARALAAQLRVVAPVLDARLTQQVAG